MAAIFWITLVIASAVPNIQGLCTHRSGKSNFDTSKFLGTWYIIKDSSISPSYGLESIRAEVSSTSTDSFAVTVNSYNTTSQQQCSLDLSFQKSSEGKFVWNIPGLSGESEITVVETDYTNYAVWQMCIPIHDNTGTIETWSVASRTSALEENLLRDAEGLLPKGNYRIIDHSY